MELPYPEDYIALQVAFGRRMATLAGQPIADTLLTMTSLYKMVGAAGQFDAGDAAWHGLLDCVDERADTPEQARAVHRYYLSRYRVIPQFGDERHWGCFAYDWRPERRAIRIHFANEDAPEPGALSRSRIAARQAELCAMFAAACEEQPEMAWVIGGSWLYNLKAYRRLFPPAFGDSATPDEPHLQYRALWGQFLRRDGSLNTQRARQFLDQVAALDDPTRYAECFPLQVMLTHAPIADFVAFYGL